MKSKIYLGVDQTGAIDSKGIPKPLPACLIRGNCVFFFYLKTFSKSEIIASINPNSVEDLLVCVDCVIGLPQTLKMSWRQALKSISKFEGYGMKIARQYFHELGGGNIYHREVEIACKANSVFKEKPFQKNIQTGTYRIWKDISLEAESFFAPAVESKKQKNQIEIYEGYPSLSWRKIFELPNRQPQNVSKLMLAEFPELSWKMSLQSQIDRDPNLADALLLALTMKVFAEKESGLEITCDPEGWILGHESSIAPRQNS